MLICYYVNGLNTLKTLIKLLKFIKCLLILKLQMWASDYLFCCTLGIVWVTVMDLGCVKLNNVFIYHYMRKCFLTKTVY